MTKLEITRYLSETVIPGLESSCWGMWTEKNSPMWEHIQMENLGNDDITALPGTVRCGTTAALLHPIELGPRWVHDWRGRVHEAHGSNRHVAAKEFVLFVLRFRGCVDRDWRWDVSESRQRMILSTYCGGTKRDAVGSDPTDLISVCLSWSFWLHAPFSNVAAVRDHRQYFGEYNLLTDCRTKIWRRYNDETYLKSPNSLQWKFLCTSVGKQCVICYFSYQSGCQSRSRQMFPSTLAY